MGVLFLILDGADLAGGDPVDRGRQRGVGRELGRLEDGLGRRLVAEETGAELFSLCTDRRLDLCPPHRSTIGAATLQSSGYTCAVAAHSLCVDRACAANPHATCREVAELIHAEPHCVLVA